MNQPATSNPTEGVKGRVKITITHDRLSAMMAISNPVEGDPPVTVEEIRQAMAEAGVTYGVKEDVLKTAIDEKRYDTPINVAEGDAPKKGEDATIKFYFDTNQDHKPQEDEHGNIDYHQINFVQNTEEGALLATKTPPQPGVSGMSVTGEELNAPNGRNVEFVLGDGCKRSDDGTEVRATTAGAIVYQNNLISIKDLLVINGDVDFNVGNIDCVGSVKVSGKVQAGFTIKAGGNVEIAGNVEDAEITAEGNIIVKGGFFGKGRGSMRAKGDVFLKYAEGQKIVAGNDVIVAGELVGCHVTAEKKVLISGRNGRIVGGEIFAGKEIDTAVAGSEAGSQTFLMVSGDKSLMKEYYRLGSEIKRVQGDIDRVKSKLQDLYKLEIDGKLPASGKPIIKQLGQFMTQAPKELDALTESKSEVEAKIKESQEAKVTIRDVAYPGVSVKLGILRRDLTDEVTSIRLVIADFQIGIVPYKPDPK